MAARAAARSGCGLVSVIFPEGTDFVKPDEIIARTLPEGGRGIGPGHDFGEFLSRYSAVVAGPGMGVRPEALALIGDLLSLGRKVLIDADGLNNLAKDLSLLGKAKAEVVLTPHIGEMSRLTGLGAKDVKARARSIAVDFATSRGVTVVLKDAVSIVASADGRVYINRGGVPALAKGGSGDVLSGIIGSLMARGLGSVDAAVLGVYLHTECGRIAGERLHPESVTAGDLIDAIPSAFRELEGA
jgi:NAD(P)H-hydrate epimerase